MSAVSFHDILDQLEAASLDSAEKGRRFERLMVSYLKTDPAYAELYEEVWLWNDYPDRGNRPDTGIDLVASDKAGELTAIQCKFYAQSTTVDKAMVDSFLAASSKAEFSNRMIISTSDKWGKNAEEAIQDQFPPVARLRALDLSASPIDWSRFSIDSPEEMKKVEPHTPRLYQQEAIDKVIAGFEDAERGKLIMACGTGKTFTSLKLAETMIPDGGTVLFLVPSISLLSQTVREWTAECGRPLRSFAVCSDVKVGKRRKSDSEDITVTDLAFPASTNGEQLAQKFFDIPVEDGGLTVVFSTYQSIEAVRQAQDSKWGGGIPEFDLIVCDEAHRTTGVTLEGEEESAFVQVHSNDHVLGAKRLYMTATPRVYGDAAQSRAHEAGAVLADMGNPKYCGDEFHRLGFAQAVEEGILTDYKVLVLAVDEGQVSREFQGLFASGENELGLEDAAKLVGCWNGLAKRGNDEDEFGSDPEPMQKAVAFAGTIKNSKMIASSFNQVVENESGMLSRDGEQGLQVEVRHVDGTQNVLVRNEALDWLRQDSEEGECRILSNVKCLSEGVDVPALDAVLFLAPRKSQVDVVQSVGRVMRKLEGKKYGYVVLPIAVPAGTDPEKALNDNERYKVVWQVLQALRSHDERLDAIINKLDLTGNATGGRISIIGVGGGSGEDEPEGDPKQDGSQQLAMAFPHLEEWRDSIFARIVKKVGDRQYWDTWAKDIAQIAEHYMTRITALVEGNDPALDSAFKEFLGGLQDNLNPQVDQAQAIEMLAQHLITRPVFDALFKGYSFSESNPVSISMQRMLDLLDLERLDKEQSELESFYQSVRMRAEGITDPAAKQAIVKDLYETFFRSAFKDMADRLGIVYTPIEIVDFILKSADEALREHFGKGLEDQGVHILDPFTGTGTFITRLIQSGLISPEALEHKFRYELHANEVVLLAYYVAAINIEEAFHGVSGGEYLPFDGIVLTDTFQMHEGDDRDELPGMEVFPENNERVKAQKETEIRVIVGNPPYSAWKGSGESAEENLQYPSLDERIEETYAARSTAQLKNSLYDSYIRAIRWASDRIGDQGVICFVSNGGFIDGNTADGLRKCLTEEFSQISVFNLRGNARGSGVQRQKEKGNVFGGGSRTTIAITLLVKDPEAEVQGGLLYRDIGDYLTREEKLAKIDHAKQFSGLELETVTPNEEGDWINQRDPRFEAYVPIGDRNNPALFEVFSRGLTTSRDMWLVNYSLDLLAQNTNRLVDTYSSDVARLREQFGEALSGLSNDKLRDLVTNDPTAIRWDGGLETCARRGKLVEFSTKQIRQVQYRPFVKQWVYFDRTLNNRVYQLHQAFPEADSANFGFVVVAPGESGGFGVLATDVIPDLHLIATCQFFPRYTYAEPENHESLFDSSVDGGINRVDNITDEILADYQGTFGGDVTKDDIFFYVYGLLHSPEYRDRFQADLKKMLPRIPKVEGFQEFSDAGRKLSELHLGYESVEPYALAIEEPADPDYRVRKMKFAKRGKEKDRSTIIYNDQITVAGIPEEAYRYMLGSRSAIEWIIDRYQVKTDKKSGIVNDPNDWADEVGDPRYILDLLGRIVTVSIETMKIVDSLPDLATVEQEPEGKVVA